MRVSFAMLAVALCAAGPAQGQAVPARFANGSMPVLIDTGYTNFNASYTGMNRDLDCVEEWNRSLETYERQPGPWLIVKRNGPVFIPLSDQMPHPVTTMVYCGGNKVGITIIAAFLKGERFPDISAKIVPIAVGAAGERACLDKAAGLSRLEARYTALAPLPDQPNLDASVVFEQGLAGLAVVKCTDMGTAMLAAVGAGSENVVLERQRLESLWGRL